LLLALGLLLWFDRSIGLSPSLLDYPRGLEWHGMRIHGRGAYATPEELAQVARRLAELAEDRGRLTVIFSPWSEALFFHNVGEGKLSFPTPPMNRRVTAEIHIFHGSRFLSPKRLASIRDQLPRVGIDPLDPAAVLLDQGDRGRWVWDAALHRRSPGRKRNPAPVSAVAPPRASERSPGRTGRGADERGDVAEEPAAGATATPGSR
jgi:hypothetical protein